MNRFFIGIIVFPNGFPQQYLIPAHLRRDWEAWLKQTPAEAVGVPSWAIPLEGGTVTFENPLFVG